MALERRGVHRELLRFWRGIPCGVDCTVLLHSPPYVMCALLSLHALFYRKRELALTFVEKNCNYLW